jgi:antitoxin Phd
MKRVWQLQEAKNQLSRVIDQAMTDGAQTITRHGRPVVVVVAAQAYQRLQPRRRTVEVLRSCPVSNLELARIQDVPEDVTL